jgi:DNA-binding protein YbaB
VSGSLSDALSEHIAGAMEEIRKQQRKLVELRDELRDVSVSSRSKDRMLTVTMGPGGEVKEIKFHTDYRSMAPAQFSAVLAETINSARRELTDKVHGSFGPARVFGTRLRDSLTGGEGLDSVIDMVRGLLAEQESGVSTSDEKEK